MTLSFSRSHLLHSEIFKQQDPSQGDSYLSDCSKFMRQAQTEPVVSMSRDGFTISAPPFPVLNRPAALEPPKDQPFSIFTSEVAAFQFSFGLITEKGVWETASDLRSFTKTVLCREEDALYMNAEDFTGKKTRNLENP